MRVRGVTGGDRLLLVELEGPDDDPLPELRDWGARTLLLDRSPHDVTRPRTLGGLILDRPGSPLRAMEHLLERWDDTTRWVDQSPRLGWFDRRRVRKALRAIEPGERVSLPHLTSVPRVEPLVKAREKALFQGVREALDAEEAAPAVVTTVPWGARLSRASYSKAITPRWPS